MPPGYRDFESLESKVELFLPRADFSLPLKETKLSAIIEVSPRDYHLLSTGPVGSPRRYVHISIPNRMSYLRKRERTCEPGRSLYLTAFSVYRPLSHEFL